MDWLLSFAAGVVLAVIVASPARLVKVDRHRLFAPALLVIVAGFYVGFALASGSSPVIMRELFAACLFLILAIAGGAFYIPIAIFGLLLHGVFDAFHHSFVMNPALPAWWPAFCVGFNIAIALWVWRLWKLGKARIVEPGKGAK